MLVWRLSRELGGGSRTSAFPRHQVRSCPGTSLSAIRGLGERLNVYQLNINDFLALLVFAVVGHDTETEADYEFISSLLQELTRETCFFHVIIMEEKILHVINSSFRIGILQEEAERLRLHEKL